MNENHSHPDCPAGAYAESLRLREDQIKGLRAWLAHKDMVHAADVLQVLSGLATQAGKADAPYVKDACQLLGWLHDNGWLKEPTVTVDAVALADTKRVDPTSEDSASEQIESVRELHTPVHEWCNFHESARCECADAYCEACGDSYPCPTIQALDRSADPAPVDPVLDENDKRDRIDCDGYKWRWSGHAEVWQLGALTARGNLAVLDRHYGPLRFADKETDE